MYCTLAPCLKLPGKNKSSFFKSKLVSENKESRKKIVGKNLVILSYFYSYRMEHICDENVQQMPKDLKQHVFYEKLIHAVHIHRRALELV